MRDFGAHAPGRPSTPCPCWYMMPRLCWAPATAARLLIFRVGNLFVAIPAPPKRCDDSQHSDHPAMTIISSKDWPRCLGIDGRVKSESVTAMPQNAHSIKNRGITTFSGPASIRSLTMKHELVVSADRIDWVWLDEQLANCFSNMRGSTEPVRFMIGRVFFGAHLRIQ